MDLQALLSYGDSYQVKLNRTWKPYLKGKSYDISKIDPSHVLWIVNNKYGTLVENESNKYKSKSINNDKTEEFYLRISDPWNDTGSTRISDKSTELKENTILEDTRREESSTRLIAPAKKRGRGRPRKTKKNDKT